MAPQITKYYLLVYNAILAIGWFIILSKEVLVLIRGRTSVYPYIELELQIFQTAAILEMSWWQCWTRHTLLLASVIFHARVGLVKSPVSTTVIQVFSRLFVVWAVMHSVADVIHGILVTQLLVLMLPHQIQTQSSIGVVLCTLAWSITEVIRYSFYGFNLVGCLPSCLLWLRYTLFIVLYPMGVIGELLTSISALGEVKRRKLYSLELPNLFNMSFSYFYLLIVIMLMYIPLFPRMYIYMFGQRKKYLGQKID